MINDRLKHVKQLCLIKSRTLICIGAAITLAACNGGSSSNGSSSNLSKSVSHTKSLNNQPLKDFFLVSMGSGYESTTGRATNDQSCLANAGVPGNVIVANPQATFHFEVNEDISTLEKALNVDASSDIGGDRFGGSIAGSFANAAKDTQYATNILYLYQYEGKAKFKQGSLGQGLAALTSEAQSEVKYPVEFRTQCGNGYVAEMDAGAVLGVMLSLQFNSHADKEAFDSELSADIELAGVAAAIQHAASSSHVHTTLELSAIQQGGTPQRLNDLFGESDPQGNYPIINCGSGESSACNLMISNIITYGKEMGNQITESDGSPILDRLYYTDPSPLPYSSLGIPTQGAPDPSPQVLAAMRQLTAQYDKTVYDYNFVTHYTEALSGMLDRTANEDLGIAKGKLDQQINQVFLAQAAYHVLDCYNGYVSSECLTIRDNVESAIAEMQLTDEESGLVTYLETNAYEGDLLNYFGESNPQASDYQAADCILVPTGFSIDGTYVINCNERWLSPTVGSRILIYPSFSGSGIDIKNFNYYSISQQYPSYGQWINYSDVTLTPVPGIHNRLIGYDRVRAQGYPTSESIPVVFTALSENPA